MTHLALFVLLALSTHRVLRLVQRDHVTLRWREAAWNRWPYDAARAARVAVWEPKMLDVVFHARPVPAGETRRVSRLGYWLRCPWCLGTSLSAVAVVVADVWASLPLPVAWWLALSSAVALLSGWED